jgi:hypothetical protein
MQTDLQPRSLADWFELALSDVRACKEDPRYRISMCDWHDPGVRQCNVCLAGAVLARTLKADPAKHVVPYWTTAPDSAISDLLLAINSLRQGLIVSAASYMRGDAKRLLTPASYEQCMRLRQATGGGDRLYYVDVSEWLGADNVEEEGEPLHYNEADYECWLADMGRVLDKLKELKL